MGMKFAGVYWIAVPTNDEDLDAVSARKIIENVETGYDIAVATKSVYENEVATFPYVYDQSWNEPVYLGAKHLLVASTCPRATSTTPMCLRSMRSSRRSSA